MGIEFFMYIDTQSIVLESLKDRFILMFIIVQIVLALGYFIYIYLENEREKLNKTRDLFINAMAHEMKTPNAVILNSAEMLLENIKPEKQHHYLKMIEEVLKHYDLESKEITIDIDKKINIQCDQQLMKIVFDNLINNAFKYANKKINYQKGKIIISNDGRKIDNRDLSHIFEPLYKEDTSRNDTNSTGMGLAIVKNILDLHHFSCKIEQNEEVCFIVKFY